MKSFFTLLIVLPCILQAQSLKPDEIQRLEAQAKQVEIIRDKWGIAHVYGKTDALAVFGMMYAQCEDDFKRIERNYIEKLGRLAEVEGESQLYNDLQIRLLIDSTKAMQDYQQAAPWFKKILNAYADGINYYLYKNPGVKPALLQDFKAWYPYLWTDGSIGAINTGGLNMAELKKFYSKDNSPEIQTALAPLPDQDSGSNGFAFAPKLSKSGKAMLYINPHTTYYFRPEIHMRSDEGLNTYGAVTWGQFFIYQGFNEYCGWMHTSSNVDIADLYAENIIKKGDQLFYQYNQQLFPVGQKKIIIKYLDKGQIKTKEFLTYFTHHGPIMAKRDGKWISLKHQNQDPQSLLQSWVRTKSKNFEDYKKAMDMTANSSNNTVYADKFGNIAYWHGNFVPKRSPLLNWSKVQDGTTSSTEWQGLHPVSETVHLYNPSNGWLQNCNSTPFTVAGANSPKAADYPAYMAPDGENYRGINAVRLLSRDRKYNLDDVIALGYDPYLPIFAELIPPLVSAYQELAQNNPLKARLAEPINLLGKWDYNNATNSVAATLAQEWAFRLGRKIQRIYIAQGEKDQVENTRHFAKTASGSELLQPLDDCLKDLEERFGSWKISWGEMNRYQRLSGDISEKYDDNKPSYPIGYGSGLWGQLASVKSNLFGTKKRYAYSGNSFVCAVEFGDKIKAKSLLAGGNAGNPKSKHFNDQAKRFVEGRFKEVFFYPSDILKNAEKRYHPGEKTSPTH